MIFDFKKSQFVYMCLVILSVLLVIVLFSGKPPGEQTTNAAFGIYVENSTLRILYSFLAVVPLILLSAYYADKIAQKEHAKLMLILNMECNPKRFLNTYTVIAGKTDRYKNTVLLKTIMLGLGYLENGDMEKAISLLSNIPFGKDTKKERKLAIQGYDILCQCYLRLRDAENAKRYFVLYSKTLDAVKDEDCEAYRNELLEHGVLSRYLNFLQGNTDDAAVYFEKAMLEYPTNRQQLNASLMAALVYLKEGNTERAKDHLTYVIEKGKNLWAKGYAQERLAEMEV